MVLGQPFWILVSNRLGIVCCRWFVLLFFSLPFPAVSSSAAKTNGIGLLAGCGVKVGNERWGGQGGTCGGNQGRKVHFTYSFQKMGKNEIKIKSTSFGFDKKE